MPLVLITIIIIHTYTHTYIATYHPAYMHTYMRPGYLATVHVSETLEERSTLLEPPTLISSDEVSVIELTKDRNFQMLKSDH